MLSGTRLVPYKATQQAPHQETLLGKFLRLSALGNAYKPAGNAVIEVLPTDTAERLGFKCGGRLNGLLRNMVFIA